MHAQTFNALSGASLSETSSSEKSESTVSDKKPSALQARLRLKEAKIHFNSATKFRKAGDSGQALVEFLKASREDPRLVDAYYEQALIFREKGFHKLAVSRLEQALVIKPKFQKARLLLATIKLEQGNVTGAVEQLGESLGLSKSSATALRPEPEKGEEDEIDGVAPMILQSVHRAMKPPAVQHSDSTEKHDSKLAAAEDLSERDLAPSRPARRRKPTSRKKIREFIARRYGKTNGRHPKKHWIARIFSWPEPFKSFDGNNAGHADYSDLSPKDEDRSLAQEFREDGPEIDASDTEPELPASSPKRTLLAYNGPAATEIELIRKLPEIKEADESSVRVKPRPPASVRKESPTQDTEQKNSAPELKTASAPDRKLKLAARGWSSEPGDSTASTDPGEHPPSKKLPTPLSPEDEWTKRLRFLNEHGTATLKKGEAFMFSEDTGEAVLFLATGERIRRVIAQPIDTQEIMKSRRPDVMVPKQLFFDTSLLGTMVGSPPPPEPVRPPEPASSVAPSEAPPAPPGFKIEQMMDNPTGFMNWLKGLINL